MFHIPAFLTDCNHTLFDGVYIKSYQENSILAFIDSMTMMSVGAAVLNRTQSDFL